MNGQFVEDMNLSFLALMWNLNLSVLVKSRSSVSHLADSAHRVSTFLFLCHYVFMSSSESVLSIKRDLCRTS